MLSKEDVWECLSGIPDPDIPVVSITELGLVRDVHTDETSGKITVTVTPSYSGCPAMRLFREEIIKALKERGAKEVEIKTVLSPPWTTDWLSDTAREKMRKHGIAPPEGGADSSVLFSTHVKPVTCPWCGQRDTKISSQFGSTPCKALWFCNSCKQPFEYFKCY